MFPSASDGLTTPKSVPIGGGDEQSPSGTHRAVAEASPIVPDYEVLRLIGRGAYGEVWLARSTTGLYRAVKVVRRSTFDHDRPFEREFDGIQKFEPISHSESQVHILHVGRNDAGGYFYYVMELADDAAEPGPKEGRESEKVGKPESGTEASPSSHFPTFLPAHLRSETYLPKTLKYGLDTRGRFPFEECVQIGLALTNALGHLHKNGLVHRDVKPSNIIFVNGVPKLADIGLVTSVDATRSFVGTEGYLAPEGPGTPQADLYSLGKVLYEVSTGLSRREFPALPGNIVTIADRQHLSELNAVIVKACQVSPSDRYQSAGQMHADLESLRAGKSVKRRRLAQRRSRLAIKSVLGISVLGLFFGASLWAPYLRHRSLDPLTTGKNVGGYPPTTMRGTTNLEAWNHYKLGYFAKFRAEGTVSAEHEFSEAIRLDPKFTLAYGELFLARFGDTWDKTHEKSPDEFRKLAAKMVELDDGLAETHQVLASINFWEWTWGDAEREYREALRLNPNCMPALIGYGFFLSHVGRTRESLEVLGNARLRVDPTSAQVVKMMGHAYFVDRDFTNALAHYREACRIDPSFGDPHLRASLACFALKDYAAAISELETWEVKSGKVDPVETKQKYKALRDAFARSGSDGFWRERLEQASATLNPDEEPYAFAQIYARLGDAEESFKYLEKAYARHDELIYLIFDEFWDHWRDEPWFNAVIKRVGLADFEKDWPRRLAARRAAQP